MAEYQYLDDTGVIVPDTSTTLETVRAEFRTAFGDDLDVSAETPQGVLITGEVLARDNVIRNNAAVANQLNPNLAGGVFLDAIWGLTGGGRVKATPSIILDAVITGVPGTIIPGGTLAAVLDTGEQFAFMKTIVINNQGVANFVPMQSVEVGAIAAPANSLTQIVTGVLGWETITNPTAATLGKAEETDAASRVRRRQTLALQGVALPEAITSGLYTVEGVRSLAFRENTTDDPIVIEGVTLVPHSIYVCIDGGIDLDVARMLLRKKSIGAGWNGTTTVSVIEPYSRQSYDVKFSRPQIVNIWIRVTVGNTGTISNVAEAVRAAILAYAAGEQEGEEGFVVGGDVSPFEISSAVSRVLPSVYVRRVEVSTDGVSYSTNDIAITIAQKAVSIYGNIQVTIV
jgi:uncharacterized phage protein gp47/JayE